MMVAPEQTPDGSFDPSGVIPVERMFLGGVVLFCNAQAIIELSDQITGDDFFLLSHMAVWSGALAAAQKASRGSTAIDARVIFDNVAGVGAEGVSIDFINGLVSEAPASASSLELYAQFIVSNAQRRAIMSAVTDIAMQTVDTDNTPEEITTNALDTLTALAARTSTAEYEVFSFGGLDPASIALIEQQQQRRTGESEQGLLTGWQSFDDEFGRLNPSDLFILGGIPGIGKSIFFGGLALQYARTGKNVLVITMEMTRQQWYARAVASEARVDSQLVINRTFSYQDTDSIREATERLKTFGIYIVDAPTINPAGIYSAVMRLQRLYRIKFDVVFIDYMQLMQPDPSLYKTQRKPSEYDTVTHISKKLKGLAKRLEIPMCVISSLSRGDKGENTRPTLARLRASGQIEYDADKIVFLWRKKEDNDSRLQIVASIAKNRNGRAGADIAFGVNYAYGLLEPLTAINLTEAGQAMPNPYAKSSVTGTSWLADDEDDEDDEIPF